jgi:flagellar basal-body rod modification protein FlgD
MPVIDSSYAASPATAQSVASEARSKLSENFDTFLSLLTAQLSNQDPLNPVDSAQFTQQLVQYSQVEQQIATNDKLSTLLSQSQSAGTASAVSFIGKTAVFSSDVARLADGAAKWTYDVTGATGDARLSVRDATGREVYSESVPVGSGAKTFEWNGRDANGRNLPAGPYRLVVTATDAQGEAIVAKTSVEESITGIDFGTAGAATVMTAAGMRAFDSIRSVRN